MREKIARAICRIHLQKVLSSSLYPDSEREEAINAAVILEWRNYLPETDAALKVITDEFAKHGITMEMIK